MKQSWLKGCVFILFLAVTPSVVFADLTDILSNVHPYISMEEEFNSNIFLSAHNPVDDFITRINPGLKFATKDSDYGIDLDYRLGLVFYAKETDNNFVGHSGMLNAWYTLDRRLTFRVSEYVIRSEEPRERDYTPGALPVEYLLGTDRTRSVYFRNVFQPSVEYQFGKEDLISINYRNNFYDNQNPSFPDSRENYINPRLAYWFDIRNGIVLEYGLTLGEFQRSPDLTGHTTTARYIYRFDPKTSIFGEYTFLQRNFQSPGIDYDVHRPTIGIEHAFSPTLSVKAQLGYFWENPKKGSKASDPYFDISVIQRGQKTTYTLLVHGGYTEDYFSAQNLGFTKYYRGIGTVSHQLKERWTVGLSGSLERAKFPSSERDWIWGVWGDASYQILKWLTLSLVVSHREDRSNINTSDYSEYRGLLRATASF